VLAELESVVVDVLAELEPVVAVASGAPPDATVSPELALVAESSAAGASAVVVWSELDTDVESVAGAGGATGFVLESADVVVGAGAGSLVGAGAGVDVLVDVTLASVVCSAPAPEPDVDPDPSPPLAGAGDEAPDPPPPPVGAEPPAPPPLDADPPPLDPAAEPPPLSPDDGDVDTGTGVTGADAVPPPAEGGGDATGATTTLPPPVDGGCDTIGAGATGVDPLLLPPPSEGPAGGVVRLLPRFVPVTGGVWLP
jgi:hypothetical protein